MADIKPFKGYIYNPNKVDYQDITSPPYDVISPEFQQRLYDQHPYNAIRLELPKEENKYSAAAERWNQWRKDEILVQDERPAVYVYDQTFKTKDGQSVTRKGFIARLRVVPFSDKIVLPHEKTLTKAKSDRLSLFKETAANFSPIFLLYQDDEFAVDHLIEEVRDDVPFMDVTDYQEANNHVWRLTNVAVLDKLQELMKNKTVYIADGHHRYETALEYARIRAAENPNHTGHEAYNFVMAYFTSMSAPDLVVYPTHRLVHGLLEGELGSLDKKLPAGFDLFPFSAESELKIWLRGEKTNRFGMVRKSGNDLTFTGIRFNGDQSLFTESGQPKELQLLDVSILHQIIIRQLLDISQDAQDMQTNLYYSKDWNETIGEVKSGKAQIAFLMNPTPVESIKAVSNLGFVMPQKSTFFYPKVITGIAFSDLND
jgi:uncharacterized protein (DUF1015 family)